MLRPPLVARLARLLPLCLVALCCAACHRTSTLADPPTPAARQAPFQADSPLLEPGIYEVTTGDRIGFEALMTRLDTARFVLVGETHDDPFSHKVQAELYRARAARPGLALLGLEMVQAPYQSALDAYASGQIDEQAFLEQSQWAERWGFDPEFYLPAMREARASKAPILALNAPRELSRRVSQVGFEGLNEQERAQLPDTLALENAAHRAWFDAIFAAHGMSGEDAAMRDRFYQAQVLWDETMASRAVAAMRQQPPAATLVVFAGEGHVMRRFGIADRISRRAPEATVLTVIPVAAPAPPESLQGPTGATQRDLSLWREQRYADYVWVQ